MVRTWSPRGCTPLFYHSYRRDKISAITALVASPKRRRLGLFVRLRKRNLTGLDIWLFVRHLLRHLQGHIFLLWDNGSIHTRKVVKDYIRAHPRLHIEPFPSYAPELNPAERIWTQVDRALANSVPEDLDELDGMLRTSARRVRLSQKLLRSCIHASELPWKR